MLLTSAGAFARAVGCGREAAAIAALTTVTSTADRHRAAMAGSAFGNTLEGLTLLAPAGATPDICGPTWVGSTAAAATAAKGASQARRLGRRWDNSASRRSFRKDKEVSQEEDGVVGAEK